MKTMYRWKRSTSWALDPETLEIVCVYCNREIDIKDSNSNSTFEKCKGCETKRTNKNGTWFIAGIVLVMIALRVLGLM